MKDFPETESREAAEKEWYDDDYDGADLLIRTGAALAKLFDQPVAKSANGQE